MQRSSASGPDCEDLAYIQRFERCEITEQEWTHEAHVRIGWIAQMTSSPAVAEQRLRQGILRHNTVVLGRPEKYHETVTVAFARLIRDRMRPAENWQSFRRRAEDLLSRDDPVLLRYYSPDRLFSPEARRSFVAPDRAPLPGNSGGG